MKIFGLLPLVYQSLHLRLAIFLHFRLFFSRTGLTLFTTHLIIMSHLVVLINREIHWILPFGHVSSVKLSSFQTSTTRLLSSELWLPPAIPVNNSNRCSISFIRSIRRSYKNSVYLSSHTILVSGWSSSWYVNKTYLNTKFILVSFK